MGWRAIFKDGKDIREETPDNEGVVHGRPVQQGEEGLLLAIEQEDYGHKVAVDLSNGLIAIDYEQLDLQNGQISLINPKLQFWICDETNIVGDLRHVEASFPYARDEDGKKILHEGRFVKVRVDTHIPLTWRPIWFTRYTDGVPTKVIGAQTTQPREQGSRNAKKMVNLYPDGRIGID